MPEMRHPRLHAFYYSKVLNALMIVIISSLLIMVYLKSLILPGVCISLAMVCFIVYSLWLWIKKPDSIVINSMLSFGNSLLTYYFLIIVALKVTGRWWYIAPAAFAAILISLALTNKRDVKFRISHP